MRTFPQEIVDMVIDQLPNGEWQQFAGPTKISQYSTVSRQWVVRTQKRHFESVRFRDQSSLEKWRTTIEPDPSGVSCHTRELTWNNVDTLEGFDSHIRAFTHVKTATLAVCGALRLPSIVETLAPMGSTIVKLGIDGGSTTYSIITSLLAALPRLRHLRVHWLEVSGDRDVTVPRPKVPFFEDADILDLRISWGSLDWICPSARVRDLRIDPCCISLESGRVQQVIFSSASSLKFLSIKTGGGPDFTPLDLSGCTVLESLQIGIAIPRPRTPADCALPSLYSFPPPKVILAAEWSDYELIDYRSWEVMARHLSRAAKQFKTTHPGRTMEVEISLSRWHSGYKSIFVRWLTRTSEAMLKLKEDANVVITNERAW